MKNTVIHYQLKNILPTFLRRISLAGLTLATMIVAIPAYSQTVVENPGLNPGLNTYIFPGATQQTQVIIGNINSVSASVTVAFYGTGGNILSVIEDLGPGQETRVDPTAVQQTAFSGSIEVTSPVPLAASAVQNQTVGAAVFNAEQFDYMPSATAASELVIPFAPADGSGVVLNIFNPGTDQAVVRVVTVKTNGVEVGTQSVTVNPDNTSQLNIGNSPGTTHIFVRSAALFGGDRPVAVNAFINGWTPTTAGVAGAIERTDFAITPAIPFTTSTTTTIPYYAEGNGFFSVVQAVNLSNLQQTLTLTAYSGCGSETIEGVSYPQNCTGTDGTLITGTNNPAIVFVPPYGSTRLDFSNMFITSSTTVIEGWVTIKSGGGPVGNSTNGGPVVGVVGIGNVSTASDAVILSQDTGSTNFAFQQRLTGRVIYNSMSFLNVGNAAATMNLTFMDDFGDNVSSETVTVPQGQALLNTLATIFPEAQGNGYLLVRSTQPIMANQLDGRTDGSAMGSLPVATASSSFTPPAQTSYLTSGIVWDLNPGTVGMPTGVPNVAVELTGPVQESSLTDAAGTYVFEDLPPGTYTVTPVPIGYTVTPPATTFTITNSNYRHDDFVIGLTAPTLTLLTPETALVGSSSVTVAIQGTNFNPGSVLAFQTTTVPTTYIDPQDLTATIPASLLTVVGNVEVFVRNTGPSGDYIQSNPFIFIVGSTGPTITSVSGLPNPLITGSVTAPFTVYITGNGFTPASQVVINLVGRPTTYISQYEVTAVLQPSDVNTIPGYIPLYVQNPFSVQSNTYQVPILYPTPIVSSISPNAITAAVPLTTQPLILTVNGTNFDVNYYNPSNTAVVLVNGTPVSTNYISATQLSAIVPQSLFTNPGNLQVTVTNPTPSLVSNAVPLLVTNPVPTITNLQTSGTVSYNSSIPNNIVFLPVLINGSNFSASAQVWFNPPCDNFGYRQATSVTRNSDTQLVATIALQCAGNYQIYVVNSQPGGGDSNVVTLSVPSGSAAEIVPPPASPLAPRRNGLKQ